MYHNTLITTCQCVNILLMRPANHHSDDQKITKEGKEALRILEEIEENINVCCAITMEPDEVLVLIDKIKEYIEKYNKYNG